VLDICLSITEIFLLRDLIELAAIHHGDKYLCHNLRTYTKSFVLGCLEKFTYQGHITLGQVCLANDC